MDDPKLSEVLVRLIASGICHTDVLTQIKLTIIYFSIGFCKFRYHNAFWWLKLIRGFVGMGVSRGGAIIFGISRRILVLILITDLNKKRKLKRTI
ncbi:hypothetical protein ASG65_01015 [Bacillus sp. Leaf13]|nr:hypothetical protein ASG65_01015 [Bacillus sp. Leaf13]